MPDIKTTLREVTFALVIALLKNKINFELKDLYNSTFFIHYVKDLICNGCYIVKDDLSCYNPSSNDYKNIVNNAYNLANYVYNHKEFNIKPDDKVQWLGDQKQYAPIDVSIGNYKFSLKEKSYILNNMGLYQFLNILTNSNYSRGLHIFNTFAKNEYDNWFKYSWKNLYDYLQKNQTWSLTTLSDKSYIKLDKNNIIFIFNNIHSTIPINISTCDEYIKNTSSKTREKCFAKWINNVLSYDDTYKQLKKICSKKAGIEITNYISNSKMNKDSLYNLFRIFPFEYYYLSFNNNKPNLFKVPSTDTFDKVIQFKNCRYEIPESQLNIITSFKNIQTNKELQFRNECRFSHGQFNGTPEAKMYITRDTALENLYIQL